MLTRSITIFFLLYQCGAALKADQFFKICHKKDPNLDQCIAESLNELKPSIRKGIPKLRIPSLEPMFVPKVSVLQGSGPVSIDSTFTDLKIHGITNYNIVKVVSNLDKYRIEIEATLPYLYNEGGYTMDGKILVLPITGKGTSWGNYTDVTITAILQGSPQLKDGINFFHIDQFKFDLNVQKAVIHLDNLFNGNKELGDAMNRFMSDNWEAVYKELKPVINGAVSTLLSDVASKVFNVFPMDQLFPE